MAAPRGGFFVFGAQLAPLNKAPDDGALDAATVTGDAGRTLIHWGRPRACPADFNTDGSVDLFDLARFVQAFAAQDPAADVAAPFGVWDFFDVSAFVGLFNAGCP